MAKLQVKGLRHQFPDGEWGLDGIDLSLESGTLTVLSGSNGCGKTLFLKHLVGLELAAEGEILLDGEQADKNWSRTRKDIGFVFQDADNQIIEATVIEDAAFGPRQKGQSRTASLETAAAVLQRCGLDHKTQALCSSLSGGEKRRLTLAGVLALQARVLLLDEPFTGLDQAGTRVLLNLLLDLKAQGCCLLLVTHELEKCLAHADNLVLMKQGRIVAQGSPGEVWEKIPEAGVHRPVVERNDWKKLTWLAS